MNRVRTLIGVIVVGTAVATVPLRAHDVPSEQIVRMIVLPEGAELVVLLRIPATLLGDANLPKTGDGHLRLRDMDPALRVVAGEAANQLEFEQDGTPLRAPRTRAILSMGSDASFATGASARERLRNGGMSSDRGTPSDRNELWNQASIDVELSYTIARGGHGLSARLNLFRSPGQSIRTVVVYDAPPDAPRTLSLEGAPERVELDPDRSDAIRGFAVRGFLALGERGDWLLFLACLALPLHARRDNFRAVMALLAGQLIGLPAGAFQDLPSGIRAALDLTAASVIVIATLHNIAGAAARWLWPLALLFGVLIGLIVGQGFRDVAMFAGSHTVTALLAFGGCVAAAQVWAGTVLWSSVNLAYRSGLAAYHRIVSVAVSIAVTHTAVHWMMERGEEFARFGSVTAEHAIRMLTLGWAGLILGAGMLGGLLVGARGEPVP